MTRLTLLLIPVVSLAAGCSKPPALAPEMSCEALAVELEDAERRVRTLGGDATDLDARDLMGDVHARSNQGDGEWRQAKRLREAQEHLEAVKAAIANRCPANRKSNVADVPRLPGGGARSWPLPRDPRNTGRPAYASDGAHGAAVIVSEISTLRDGTVNAIP